MMSPFPIRRVLCGSMLLLSAARTAGAQHAKLYVGTVPSPGGQTRELVCRGKPGIDLRVEQDPSPRRADQVAMVLRYERPKEVRSVGQEGMGTVDYGRSVQFIPGSCTWNRGGFEGVPPEPGVVYFDLPRDGQLHAGSGQRDTTAAAAISFPDIGSMTRYLSDSTRFWLFYVNDATNLSISFRSSELVTLGPTGYVAGSLRDAAPGSATLSSARVLSDSAARTRVVRTPTTSAGVAGPLRDSGSSAARTGANVPAPTAAGTVAGPLRDPSPTPATTASARPLPTDSTARRTAAVRTPTPTSAGAGVRDASSATMTRAPSTTVTTKQPADANAPARQLQERRIWDVQVRPGPRGVRISFHAQIDGFINREQRVWSRITTDRPHWDEAQRQWDYPDWVGFMSTHLRTLADGRFEIQPATRLYPGRRYYYLIEVHASEPTLPNVQRTGSFIAEFGE